MFDMRNSWKKDAASTKSLAFDCWFITLYSVELDRAHITLSEHVNIQVPTSWNPAALAEFIEKYGTHIVVGVKMGGKDVVHIKQFKSLHLQPTEVQRLLKKEADKRFSEDEDGFFVLMKLKYLQVATLKGDRDEPWKIDVALAASVRPTVKSHSTKEVGINFNRHCFFNAFCNQLAANTFGLLFEYTSNRISFAFLFEGEVLLAFARTIRSGFQLYHSHLMPYQCCLCLLLHFLVPAPALGS